MINEKIKKDVNDEFTNLKNELQVHLKPVFDVSKTKQFLQTHIPKEIVYKSGILLDTLLNYLMEDASSKIKNADITTQNAFFDVNFRGHIHEWSNKLENKLALKPDLVNYTFDPRLKHGLVVSGIAFVVGSGIALTLIPGVVGTIVSGVVAILFSAFAFKIAYDKSSPKAREFIKKDIDQYLETSQKQVVEWLEKVETVFENDFHDFCSTKGFELKGNYDE